jgi:hypothetical protein
MFQKDTKTPHRMSAVDQTDDKGLVPRIKHTRDNKTKFSQKLAKKLNRNFPKEDKQIANKHIKKC